MKRLGYGRSELWALAVFVIAMAVACAQQASRISKEEAVKLIGQSNVAIIDVRTGSEWQRSDAKIQGALREDPGTVKSWMHTFGKNETLIFYCS